MKVTRANGQYLYDDNGIEYLDCVNCVAHGKAGGILDILSNIWNYFFCHIYLNSEHLLGFFFSDFITVGHSNPAVVEAAKTAMLKMGNISLGMSDIASEYVAKLKATFPSQIDTFLFVSSGYVKRS